MSKINATEKHKKVFSSVKAPGANAGESASDEDTVVLIQHLQVIPLDFQLIPSETEQGAITHCREILRSGSVNTPPPKGGGFKLRLKAGFGPPFGGLRLP